jgi:hypothetical protein
MMGRVESKTWQINASGSRFKKVFFSPAPLASSQMAFERPEWLHIEIWEHSRGARMNTVLHKSRPLDLP